MFTFFRGTAAALVSAAMTGYSNAYTYVKNYRNGYAAGDLQAKTDLNSGYCNNSYSADSINFIGYSASGVVEGLVCAGAAHIAGYKLVTSSNSRTKLSYLLTIIGSAVCTYYSLDNGNPNQQFNDGYNNGYFSRWSYNCLNQSVLEDNNLDCSGYGLVEAITENITTKIMYAAGITIFEVGTGILNALWFRHKKEQLTSTTAFDKLKSPRHKRDGYEEIPDGNFHEIISPTPSTTSVASAGDLPIITSPEPEVRKLPSQRDITNNSTLASNGNLYENPVIDTTDIDDPDDINGTPRHLVSVTL